MGLRIADRGGGFFGVCGRSGPRSGVWGRRAAPDFEGSPELRLAFRALSFYLVPNRVWIC